MYIYKAKTCKQPYSTVRHKQKNSINEEPLSIAYLQCKKKYIYETYEIE